MNKFYDCLINILRIVIMLAVGTLIITSISFTNQLTVDSFSNKFFCFELISVLIGSVLIFSKIRHKYKIWSLLLITIALRIYWVLSVNTMPISDFSSMYENAKVFLTADTSIFKGYTYLARFPHLIPMTFYMAGIIKLFPIHNLLVMKILNAIFGCITAFLLYKLSDNFIKSEKNKLFVLLLSAIFPPFVTYTSVLCTENIAIPLYLLTLILFYKAKEQKSGQIKYFFIAGTILAFSNLFRGVAIVFLIAFFIYLFLCTEKNKFANMGALVLGYIVITLSISGILLKLNWVERPLWDGVEPSSITLLLKGTNFEHNGMWNIEDAEFVDKHLKDENLKELCLEKVKERITSKTPTELLVFYLTKFVSQWSAGDCSGTYWAYTGANIMTQSTVPITFQLIYISTLIFSFIALLKKEKTELLNIILIGFVLLFIIIETQARYSYIVSWIFVLLGAYGIEVVIDFIKERKVINGIKLKRKIR